MGEKARMRGLKKNVLIANDSGGHAKCGSTLHQSRLEPDYPRILGLEYQVFEGKPFCGHHMKIGVVRHVDRRPTPEPIFSSGSKNPGCIYPLVFVF